MNNGQAEAATCPGRRNQNLRNRCNNQATSQINRGNAAIATGTNARNACSKQSPSRDVQQCQNQANNLLNRGNTKITDGTNARNACPSAPVSNGVQQCQNQGNNLINRGNEKIQNANEELAQKQRLELNKLVFTQVLGQKQQELLLAQQAAQDEAAALTAAAQQPSRTIGGKPLYFTLDPMKDYVRNIKNNHRFTACQLTDTGVSFNYQHKRNNEVKSDIRTNECGFGGGDHAVDALGITQKTPTLREYSCRGNEPVGELTACPNGCFEGKCVLDGRVKCSKITGDLNDDKRVDDADLDLIRSLTDGRLSFEEVPACADFNSDGKIDSADMTLLEPLRYAQCDLSQTSEYSYGLYDSLGYVHSYQLDPDRVGDLNNDKKISADDVELLSNLASMRMDLRNVPAKIALPLSCADINGNNIIDSHDKEPLEKGIILEQHISCPPYRLSDSDSAGDINGDGLLDDRDIASLESALTELFPNGYGYYNIQDLKYRFWCAFPSESVSRGRTRELSALKIIKEYSVCEAEFDRRGIEITDRNGDVNADGETTQQDYDLLQTVLNKLSGASPSLINYFYTDSLYGIGACVDLGGASDGGRDGMIDNKDLDLLLTAIQNPTPTVEETVVEDTSNEPVEPDSADDAFEAELSLDIIQEIVPLQADIDFNSDGFRNGADGLIFLEFLEK